MPGNADGLEPPGQPERRARPRIQNVPGYYRGVALRLCVVVFALAVAWIAPVRWPIKLEVYLAIMLVAVVAVILFRAGRRFRRT